jgi:hypothetical protein
MFDSLISNFHNPAILFFLLGILAVSLKSDLEIPGQIAKFLSMYLLFDIGIKGGGELFHSGFSMEMFNTLSICGIISFLTPFICYWILRFKMDIFNAGAIAASYGSISAINFINSTSFLEQKHIAYSGYMVASMALMEFPAVISGLLIIGLARKKLASESSEPRLKMRKVIHEALFNGSVFLLVGSLLIGYICGSSGEAELKPFVSDIFKGVLCFYMLDMGLLAGQKIKSLKNNFLFLFSFALAYPVVSASFAILIAKCLGMTVGNALLFTTLVSSASFIAVPAAMRMAVPQANMGIILPMSLGITFVFNIIFGVPIYLPTIQYLWGQ